MLTHTHARMHTHVLIQSDQGRKDQREKLILYGFCSEWFSQACGTFGRKPLTRRLTTPPHTHTLPPWGSIASIFPFHHHISILSNPIQHVTFQEICLSHKINHSYCLEAGNSFNGGSLSSLREYVSPDFILLLFHLVSSHAPGSESSSFYRPIPNAYTSNSSCFDDDDDSIEHLL